MKKGNKALWIIVLALVFYIAVGLLFMPREGKARQENEAPQKEGVVKEDSLLSYAIGVISSMDVPFAIEYFGISDTEVDDFIRGMRDAFPVDESPAAVAYVRGLQMGAEAMEIFEDAEYDLSKSDTTKKVNREIFFEGVADMVTGDLELYPAQAQEYYFGVVFRAPSEAFIKDVESRGGVKKLKNGALVKIETEGYGETPDVADTIGYIYKASFINGRTFDSSEGEVQEVKVATLLPGLIDVVTALPVGTKCKAYLPWQTAYGENGDIEKNVPPYNTIVYDLEIVKIVK